MPKLKIVTDGDTVMKDRYVIRVLLLASLFLIGCGHLKTIKTADISEFSSEINQLATNQKATITVVDSVSYWTSRNGQWIPHGEARTVTAFELNVGSDSTSWRDITGFSSAPTDHIWKIQFRTVDHEKGALKGLGVGALVGALVGSTLLIIDSEPTEPPHCDNFSGCSSIGLGLDATAGIIAGSSTIIGLFAGMIAGEQRGYRYVQSGIAPDHKPMK